MDRVTLVLTAAGALASAVLITLLLRAIRDRDFQFWPAPRPESWQRWAFWSLFRTSNLIALAVAILDCDVITPADWSHAAVGLPATLVGVCLYGPAYVKLGLTNTYCGRSGLVTNGIYGWTRNPQYLALIVTYAGIALTANSAAAYLLCTLLMLTFALMILAEEPWPRATYGDAFDRYCRRTPRFFNWKRAIAEIKGRLSPSTP